MDCGVWAQLGRMRTEVAIMPRLLRKYIFDESEPGIYHCINRCVRRAFLCGTDPATGECFEHRKVALQERLAFLAGQLGIDILGFAVMSNHIHVVARNRPDLVAKHKHGVRPCESRSSRRLAQPV